MRQAEERRRFMENRHFNNPYEEMKSKYLKTDGSRMKSNKKLNDSISKSLEN